MTTTDATIPESRTFEADVAKLLYLMVHSVYSDKDVFLRELISNAADACERLRYEAIANPALLDDDPKPRITVRGGQNRRGGERGERSMNALVPERAIVPSPSTISSRFGSTPRTAASRSRTTASA